MLHVVKMAFDTPSKEEANQEAELLVELRNLVTKKDIKMLIEIIKKEPSVIELVRSYYGKNKK